MPKSCSGLLDMKKFPLSQFGFGVVLFIFTLGSGCATPGQGTGIGAGIGAATGAAVGGATKGWTGAGVGAVAGAATGAAFGNYLDRRTEELKKLADARKTQDGILVQLKSDLLFPTGSAVLKDSAIEQLDQLGDLLANYKKDRLKIEGFTDSVGSAPLNEVLSLRRAESVQRVLVGRGIEPTRIIVLGKGEHNPIADNTTLDGRAQNRRVEIKIETPRKT